MSAGLGQGFREDYDNKWGGLALQLNQLMNAIQAAKVDLDTFTVAGLVALPARGTQYVTADATLLKNAAADMDTLRKIYQGLMFLASGSTPNSGVPTAVDGTHFGYNFQSLNIGQIYGLGT